MNAPAPNDAVSSGLYPYMGNVGCFLSMTGHTFSHSGKSYFVSGVTAGLEEGDEANAPKFRIVIEGKPVGDMAAPPPEILAPMPPLGWEYRAASNIIVNLLRRRGIKNELEQIAPEIRAEILNTMCDIIRKAWTSSRAGKEGS